ncbi:MAG TPA: HEAT repeat domain-containing protein [Methanocorpusculum sp.]|nr:HEAT repeat domain-containing protein [Methanocorpusculum sp.]
MSDVFADVKSSDMAVRRNAEDELVRLIFADSSIINKILEEIRGGDVTSRWYLARALTRSGKEIIPVLISYAETEKDAVVQKYIGAVLASFKEAAVDPLVGLFSSENPQARGMAASALERIGQPSLEALLKAAQSDNPTVRICAGLVLQKGGIYDY